MKIPLRVLLVRHSNFSSDAVWSGTSRRSAIEKKMSRLRFPGERGSMLEGILCKESVNLRGGDAGSGILIEASVNNAHLVNRNCKFQLILLTVYDNISVPKGGVCYFTKRAS